MTGKRERQESNKKRNEREIREWARRSRDTREKEKGGGRRIEQVSGNVSERRRRKRGRRSEDKGEGKRESEQVQNENVHKPVREISRKQ